MSREGFVLYKVVRKKLLWEKKRYVLGTWIVRKVGFNGDILIIRFLVG